MLNMFAVVMEQTTQKCVRAELVTAFTDLNLALQIKHDQ